MKKFLNTYKRLNANNLQLLTDVYAEDVRFIDPVHEISTLVRLTDYFGNLYSNISSIPFKFSDHQRVADQGYVQWGGTFPIPA